MTVKERPILFSAPMIRALLAGTKTQTRRVVKPQPDLVHEQIVARFTPDDQRLGRIGEVIKCPYGKPGDLLWVRENFAPRVDEELSYERWMTGACTGPKPEIQYAADGGDPYISRWRPSIHMPRWACRILLEIVSVRVERLQDISASDAKAEGCIPLTGGDEDDNWIRGYRLLWEMINGAGSWEANPFVWVVEFRRIKP